MVSIISKILLAVSLLIIGYVSMVKLSETNEPKKSNSIVTVKFRGEEPMPESEIDTDWISNHGKEICFAGVSLRSRWGEPGQAKLGTYLQEQNGVYSYRSHEGDSDIHCTIDGSKILMSWSSQFKDDPNRYYTFKNVDDGKNVEVTEYEWGATTSRIFPVR